MKTTSELSNEVVTFTGSHLESVSENFDNSPLPYYYITENWTQTNEVYISGNNSFSNAAFTQHKPEQFDTLIFLPVKMPNEDDLYLTFMQICAVYPDDSAFVEVSYNDMESWEIIANYNRDMHEAWKKSVVDNSGWRLERVKIPNQIDAEKVFVRFRFISNRIRNGNGWYIDDVVIGQKAVTVDNNDFGNSVKVFPNPAVDVLNIHSGYNEFSNVKLFDLHGSLILEYVSDNTSSVELDLNQFNSGSYFLEIKSDKGFVSRKIIFINK
jgi:hypothetical protein